MAALLADFLPGSGARDWKGHVTFASVSRDVGVSDFWPGGTKEAALAALLERTLDQRIRLFESLILAIVRNGITYRQRKGRPVKRHDIDVLNQYLLRCEFRFPDLNDAQFLAGLPPDPEFGDRERPVPDGSPAAPPSRSNELEVLRTRFYELATLDDRQRAGRMFEALLNDLFALFDLPARRPFTVVGEQIDGSFTFDGDTYLVEAKWTTPPVGEAELLIFRGKIEGKSAWTRGVFVSAMGYTPTAIQALVRGKQPTFFLLDGYDITVVLEEHVTLPDLLSLKRRKLEEEGAVYTTFRPG